MNSKRIQIKTIFALNRRSSPSNITWHDCICYVKVCSFGVNAVHRLKTETVTKQCSNSFAIARSFKTLVLGDRDTGVLENGTCRLSASVTLHKLGERQENLGSVSQSFRESRHLRKQS